MIVIITPHGHFSRVERGGPPTLAELQGWVGGFIEVPGGGIRLRDGVVQFVVNDAGKLAGLPTNAEATCCYRTMLTEAGWTLEDGGPMEDWLVGTVVVLTSPNILR